MLSYINEIQKIEIQLLETSSLMSKYLLSFNGRNFEANAPVVDLISILKQTNSMDEIICLFSELRKKTYTREEIENLIDKYIKPIVEIDSLSKKHSFIWKKELISSFAVSKFSSVLKILFNYKLIIFICVISSVLEIIFFKDGILINDFHVNLYVIILIIVLFFISSLVHEFGHASACKFFAVDHGGIGVGLYLNFPVFYTDVTNVWKLSRQKRMVVNFAGVYFQLILLSLLLLIYFYTYSLYVQYFIYLMNINFLITLNPFFKFDGYWIMSDLLGVPNLRMRTAELLRYYLKKMMRNKMCEKPFLLSMRKKEKIFMLIYSVVINFFFLYYFCYILPTYLYDFIDTYPDSIKKLIAMLTAGETLDYHLIQVVFFKLLFFIFTLYLLVRIIIKYANKSISVIKNIDVNT